MSAQLLPPIAVLASASAASSSPFPLDVTPAPAPAAKKGKGKENAALQQSSLASFVNAGAPSKGKKRSLTLANGCKIYISSSPIFYQLIATPANIDLNEKALPATKEVRLSARAYSTGPQHYPQGHRGNETTDHRGIITIHRSSARCIYISVIQLEDELAGQPPAKKARTSKAAEKLPEPTPASSTSLLALAPAKPSAQEAKKNDALLKKMWTR